MKLSVIIPCYNVADCLGATINSVINQNDSLDYEIIVVNDGSSDETVEVAQKILSAYDNYKIINKENGGVSSARNEGLLYAKGEYVYFLDGDDIVHPDLFGNIKKNNSGADIIYWNYLQERSATKVRQIDLFSNKDLVLEYLYGNFSIHISSLIIRRQLILDNKLRFDENTAYGEDREFIAKCLYYSETKIFIRKYLFTYKWRSNSAMNKKKNYGKKQHSGINAMLRLFHFFESRHDASYINASLSCLCVTLLIHKRELLNDKGNIFASKVDGLLEQYLCQCPYLFYSKHTLFVAVSKLFYNLDKDFFEFFLKRII